MNVWDALRQERRGLSCPGGASLACGGPSRKAGRLLSSSPCHASREAAKAGVRSLRVAQWSDCKSLLQLGLFGFNSTPGVGKPTIPLGGQEAVIFFAVSINHHQQRENMDAKWGGRDSTPFRRAEEHSVDWNSTEEGSGHSDDHMKEEWRWWQLPVTVHHHCAHLMIFTSGFTDPLVSMYAGHLRKPDAKATTLWLFMHLIHTCIP